MASITWEVVHYDGPTPEEDALAGYAYRGPGRVAVPGDTVRVLTPDGWLEGEPCDELTATATHFFMLVGPPVYVYRVSTTSVECIDPWFETELEDGADA